MAITTGLTIEAADVNALKDYFFPVTGGIDFPVVSADIFNGALINATTDTAYIVFYVPSSYNSIVEAVVVLDVTGATSTDRLNFLSEYAADGENRQTHSESDDDNDVSVVQFDIQEVDISGILSAIAAGDYVAIRVLGDVVNTPEVMVLGVRLKFL